MTINLNYLKKVMKKLYSNPLRILDSKQDNDIALSNNAPKIQNNISINCQKSF